MRRLVAEHAAGERDHHRVLWQLLVLEEWHRKFIDQEAATIEVSRTGSVAAAV